MQSLKDYISSFADEQTYERLKQCGEIEDALTKCQRIRKLAKKAKGKIEQEPSIRLTDTRAGMKIARYYDWGLSNPKAEQAVAAMRGDNSFRSLHPTATEVVDAAQSEKVENRSQYKSTKCSKETHALWGCRAMALGCASELVKLKKCMIQKHNSTDPKYFTYDSKKDFSNAQGCQIDMQALGNCVSEKWKDLNQRLNK